MSDAVPEQAAGLLAGFVAGSQVAGYRLEEQIGAGGMAVVFRARDERLHRLVALKILAPALAADSVFRQRFIRESRSAAAVDDPHIIPVHEAGEASGVLFIAMRYVPGGDVRSLLDREGPLPPSRAAAIISPVASALDAAHAAGLVHRDVKPGNILVDTRPDRPDHVYLADFGLSKGALSSIGLTGSGQFIGTPDYSAPEQIEGRTVDGRTDQYALACAAFELLCGEAPFHRDQGLAVIYAHLSEPPPSLTARLPDLPSAADEVFARAMAKAPADRYASCREFADALRGALGLAPYHPGPGAMPPAEHPVTQIAPPAVPDAAEQGAVVAGTHADVTHARGAQQAPSLQHRQVAELTAREMTEARKVLLDPQAKEAYDAARFGRRAPGPAPQPPGPTAMPPTTPQPTPFRGPVPQIWPQPGSSRPSQPRPRWIKRRHLVWTAFFALVAVDGFASAAGVYGPARSGNLAENAVLGVIALLIAVYLSGIFRRR